MSVDRIGGMGYVPRVPTRSLKQEILNVPNLMTFARIFMIPVFLVFLYYETRVNSFIAALIFIVAGITDVLDGFIARRFNLTTVLGKFLDPIADKLMVMAAMVLLVDMGRVPAWVVIVILAREFIISALRTLAMSEGVVMAAGQGGKWKTSLQVVGLIALIVHYPYTIDLLVAQVDLDLNRVGLWLLYLSLVPGILSAFEYFWSFWVAVGEKEAAAAAAEAQVETPIDVAVQGREGSPEGAS